MLYFEKGWNGYKYWMSYTPYPKHDSRFENPCIAVSNDLKKWEIPLGLKESVLDDLSYNTDKKIYNSDAHLLYNKQNDSLELWWRYLDDNKNYMCLFRRVSKDGINWSPKEKILESLNRKKKDYVSPAIIKDGDIYKMWYVDKRKIFYTESGQDLRFKKIKYLEVDYGHLSPWHIDVIKNENVYEMISVAYKVDARDHYNMQLYYCNSKDNEHWSKPISVLKQREGNHWDNYGLYRSSFVKVNDEYKLIYSGMDDKSNVGLGLVCGPNIKELK